MVAPEDDANEETWEEHDVAITSRGRDFGVVHTNTHTHTHTYTHKHTHRHTHTLCVCV